MKRRSSLWGRGLRTRLRDTHGFMLAEQLVSVIFIGLLCLVVAAGLSAAMSAYGSITTQTRANNLLSNAVQIVSDQLVFSQDPDAATSQYTSGSEHVRGKLQNANNGIELSYTYDVVDEDGNKGTKTGTTQLVSPKQESQGSAPILSVGFVSGKEPKYNASSNTWTYSVQVSQSGSGTVLVTQNDITVSRVMAAPKTGSGA